MALPRKNRMTKQDFTKLFRSGRRLRGKRCSIQYGPLSSETPKVAVVVQAKKVSSAVERNSIRRVLSEIIVNILPEFVSSVFVVVVVHVQLDEESLKECRQELIEMLHKSGIIK
jgi:ribonuclease P protein component